MKIQIKEKKVECNELTEIVWAEYIKAVNNFSISGNPLALDEKAVKDDLEPDGKKIEAVGWLASLLRLVGVKNSYYEFEALVVNVDDPSNDFFDSLRQQFYLAIADALYDGTSIPAVNDAIGLTSAEKIDNHFVLICEIVLRLVASALNSPTIKLRSVVPIEKDDNIVAVLKNFLLSLKDDPKKTAKLFAKANGKGVSPMAGFIDHLIDDEASGVNALIHNVQCFDAPKQSFEAINNALSEIQIRLRGFLIVYLNEVAIHLSIDPLITSNDSLARDVLISYYHIVKQTLLSKTKPSDPLAPKDAVLDKVREHLFVSDNAKIIAMFLDLLEKSQLKEQYHKALKHDINEVKKLYILDEQLEAIKEAVGQFIAFSAMGGWVPIFMNVINPQVLTLAINAFKTSCVTVTDDIFPHINHLDTQYSVGLASLPPFQWSKLHTINAAIRSLTLPKMMDKVIENFNQAIMKLAGVEQLLYKHKLLKENQHLMSSNLTPTLDHRVLDRSPTHQIAEQEQFTHQQREPLGLLPAGAPHTRIHSANSHLHDQHQPVGVPAQTARSQSYNQIHPFIHFHGSEDTKAGVDRGDAVFRNQLTTRSSSHGNQVGRRNSLADLQLPPAPAPYAVDAKHERIHDDNGLTIETHQQMASSSYTRNSGSSARNKSNGSGRHPSAGIDTTTPVPTMSPQYPKETSATSLASTATLFSNATRPEDDIETPNSSKRLKRDRSCCTIT